MQASHRVGLPQVVSTLAASLSMVECFSFNGSLSLTAPEAANFVAFPRLASLSLRWGHAPMPLSGVRAQACVQLSLVPPITYTGEGGGGQSKWVR